MDGLSAALSDVLRERAATAGTPVLCAVTPGDGKVFGTTASATATAH
jgi:hypothetical protein